jgi:hypothetical protein
VQTQASSYVNGFNDGKKSGYEQGREAGYAAGYKDRDREAQAEFVAVVGKTIAVATGITVLLGIPATAGITAYFVNRKRDKTERELRNQNDTLRFDILQWQNRVLFGIQAEKTDKK